MLFFVSRFFHAVMICVMTLLLSNSMAHASDWVVSKVRQPAQFTIDNENWMKLQRGMQIPKASWIHTGKRGRVLLKRGSETMQYNPNTLAGLFKKGRGGRDTEIKQQFGEILLDVITRDYQHVVVKTPFLAAVVKGTKFNVSVGPQSASIKVNRGVVEVTNIQRGERVDVRSGQTAAVSPRQQNRMSLTGRGKKSQIRRVPIVKAAVPTVAKALENRDARINELEQKIRSQPGKKSNKKDIAKNNKELEKLKSQVKKSKAGKAKANKPKSNNGFFAALSGNKKNEPKTSSRKSKNAKKSKDEKPSGKSRGENSSSKSKSEKSGSKSSSSKSSSKSSGGKSSSKGSKSSNKSGGSKGGGKSKGGKGGGKGKSKK